MKATAGKHRPVCHPNPFDFLEVEEPLAVDQRVESGDREQAVVHLWDLFARRGRRGGSGRQRFHMSWRMEPEQLARQTPSMLCRGAAFGLTASSGTRKPARYQLDASTSRARRAPLRSRGADESGGDSIDEVMTAGASSSNRKPEPPPTATARPQEDAEAVRDTIQKRFTIPWRVHRGQTFGSEGACGCFGSRLD